MRGALSVLDLTYKVILVIGGNAPRRKKTIKKSNTQAIFIKVDLSDLPAIRKSAQDFLPYVPIFYFSWLTPQVSRYMRFQERVPTSSPHQQYDQVTTQKYDLQFGTNIIGQACVPLCSPVRSYVIPHEKVPIITVSSSANYYLTTGIDFGAFVDGHERIRYGEWGLYKKSDVVAARGTATRSC
ncbi:hypothetical protein V8E53_006038 [Lactarius tabidus]